VSQGQGAGTLDKERRIAAAVSISARIADKPRFAGYPFWILDCNAGSGWNAKVNVPGSPLVLSEIAAGFRHLRPVSCFCDRDAVAIAELRRRLAPYPQSIILHDDNEVALQRFAATIRQREPNPHYALGVVLVDPNGYWYRSADGNGVPVIGLSAFVWEFPRIDLVLNLNAYTYQLQRGKGDAVLAPGDVLASLNRKHWLVARTYVGQSRFILAVGRNWPVGDHKALGFYHAESPQGQAILQLNRNLPPINGHDLFAKDQP
jgi:hypothetical protein